MPLYAQLHPDISEGSGNFPVAQDRNDSCVYQAYKAHVKRRGQGLDLSKNKTKGIKDENYCHQSVLTLLSSLS